MASFRLALSRVILLYQLFLMIGVAGGRHHISLISTNKVKFKSLKPTEHPLIVVFFKQHACYPTKSRRFWMSMSKKCWKNVGLRLDFEAKGSLSLDLETWQLVFKRIYHFGLEVGKIFNYSQKKLYSLIMNSEKKISVSVSSLWISVLIPKLRLNESWSWSTQLHLVCYYPFGLFLISLFFVRNFPKLWNYLVYPLVLKLNQA